jgi:hypothetical protein
VTYRRVIPRDVFNEANLLKCMGQLSLLIHDACPGALKLDFDAEAFRVEQDGSSGALEVTNLRLFIDGKQVRLTRPLNSREPWPLYCDPVLDGEWFDTVAVFDEDGDLSDEFERLIGMAAPADEEDGYPPACSDPGGHEWGDPEEHPNGRCLCVHCGADGDA